MGSLFEYYNERQPQWRTKRSNNTKFKPVNNVADSWWTILRLKRTKQMIWSQKLKMMHVSLILERHSMIGMLADRRAEVVLMSSLWSRVAAVRWNLISPTASPQIQSSKYNPPKTTQLMPQLKLHTCHNSSHNCHIPLPCPSTKGALHIQISRTDLGMGSTESLRPI